MVLVKTSAAALFSLILHQNVPSKQQLVHQPFVLLAQSTETPTASRSASLSSEYYVPRLLYPGSYGRFCGPNSAEVCKESYGENALDPVDAVCRIHDVSYCQCQSELQQRRKSDPSSFLSSLTAIRFLTRPLLMSDDPHLGVDADYFKCVNQADRRLIQSGIQIRGEQQRQGCQSTQQQQQQQPNEAFVREASSSLAWFCTPDDPFGTLAKFEKVNLNIFLRSLDSDEPMQSPEMPLTKLEMIRQSDFIKSRKSGQPIREAASGSVEMDDTRLLQRLGQ